MSDVRQGTEGEGKEPEHTHPAIEHSHDHWHVSHHHKGGLLGDDFDTGPPGTPMRTITRRSRTATTIARRRRSETTRRKPTFTTTRRQPSISRASPAATIVISSTIPRAVAPL